MYRKESSLFCLIILCLYIVTNAHSANLNLATSPIFLSESAPPLTMLVMGRDHKLFYEAYNDASDLNDDGILDVGYRGYLDDFAVNPKPVDYFGYFDSYTCYEYQENNATFGLSKFVPQANTADKKCAGNWWSGDLLNYMTTSRIDALRKVLYGGLRDIDNVNETVLERSHIPQDAHSWGKEYKSVIHDGYDISEYTPLSLPLDNTRHLFANVTLLTSGNGEPRFRVLTDSQYRVWNWLSKERPVAGDHCQLGPCAISGGDFNHAFNHEDFLTLIQARGTPAFRYGSGPVNNINGWGNPFGYSEEYFSIFSGTINIPADGNYTFGVDGDDAVEFSVDGSVVAAWYGGHGRVGNGSDHQGTVYLTAGNHDITFLHEENWGGDNYFLYWKNAVNNWEIVPATMFTNLTMTTYDWSGFTRPSSDLNDYVVRVEVCKNSIPEDNCQLYDSGHYKPTGLLQKYGENDTMLFGLLTGSYAKNTSGGVLRKKVNSITDEINLVTGQLDSSMNGIISTIDKFKTVGFGGWYAYLQHCGWITHRPINEGECLMWGNPIAEMQYEALRYFSGKGTATPDFNITGTDPGGRDADNFLGLALEADWSDPYTPADRLECSKPFSLVISDINPSYDTDQLPGSHWGGFAGDVAGLDVDALGDTIWDGEFGSGATKNIFIGESGGVADSNPTPKIVSSFGDIRGLAPEEPTKLGGYYSASIAYYGLMNDINSNKPGDQNMQTFTVAVASPLPRIEIPINNSIITLVPFAKSVGTNGGGAYGGNFQPTNTIVDFYIDTITPTYGKFRINYEDVEQGADHDMDAIGIYEYQINDDGTVTISLESEYASGSIIQHMGYVISGTQSDDIYLEIRDIDTSAGIDVDYNLDTPNTAGVALPLTASRTFTPGVTNGASLLKDPLWYAAKWGGFIDANNDGVPTGEEWDRNHDGNPDNYFLVTNALNLQDQLSASFDEILARTSSAASVSLNSISLNSSSRLYQVRFNSKNWSGQVLSFPIESDGGVDYSGSSTGGSEWDAATVLEALDPDTGRVIITQNGTRGIPFRWPNDHASPGVSELNSTQTTALLASRPYAAVAGNDQAYGEILIDYLRGDHTHEGAGRFRSRSTPLGDLIHSAPYYVAAPPYNYPDNIESVPYSSFRSQEAIRNRRHMIYTGANDGMLHGFDAGTGAEKLAFVPNAVYSQLNKLANSSYNDNHQYYVDGSPIVGDAFFNNGDNAWHTVLVSGLRGGGKSIFALDVTNPVTFSESNANDLFLWEYTDSADLGFTYGQVAIAAMRNGQWAAIFGNGYNSSNGHSVLYLVDIATGNLIKKIDTGRGPSDDPTGETRSNGMATPAPVDVDGDRRVDFIYAGDLHGHMWKVDVRGSSSADWAIAYTRDNDDAPMPLFTTESDQAITTRPEVSAHSEGGYVINFGTGKYLEETDKLALAEVTQTFYGIWDRDVSNNIFKAFSKDDLFQHEILLETAEFGFDLRVTTDNDGYDWHENDNSIPSDDGNTTYLGWYLDLVNTDIAPLNNQGEKQVTNPILRHGRIVFSTLVPNADACRFGGTSWLMEMDAQTGSRLKETPFDLNDDGGFTAADFVTVIIDGVEVSVPVSGKKSKVGITETPGVLKSGGQAEYKYSSGTGSSDATVNPNLIEVTRENGGKNGSGRQSWRQLQ